MNREKTISGNEDNAWVPVEAANIESTAHLQGEVLDQRLTNHVVTAVHFEPFHHRTPFSTRGRGEIECFGVFARLIFVEQSQKDGGVVRITGVKNHIALNAYINKRATGGFARSPLDHG
jgi:hypothetical protein